AVCAKTNRLAPRLGVALVSELQRLAERSARRLFDLDERRNRRSPLLRRCLRIVAPEDGDAEQVVVRADVGGARTGEALAIVRNVRLRVIEELAQIAQLASEQILEREPLRALELGEPIERVPPADTLPRRKERALE